MKILVVEDDPLLGSGLVELLQSAGHSVELAVDGRDGAQRAIDHAFELLILDLMLPGLDGFEVCRRIRVARPGVPVLMLTALGAEDDKVRGLRLGADDYITKPFGARELLARVDALFRRIDTTPAMPEIIDADGCRIDLGRCVVVRDGETIPLTVREAGIVRWLYRHRARAVSRGELLKHVWGVRARLETRTVDMAIVGLRSKIERDTKRPRLIRSIKTIGYAWAAGDSQEQPDRRGARRG